MLVYDRESNSAWEIPRQTTSEEDWPYGATWWEDKLYVAWRNPSEIVEYDNSLKVTRKAPVGKKDGAHQMTCKEGELWMADTELDRFFVVNANTLKHKMQFNPDKDKPAPGHRHWNSVAFYGDEVWLMAHSWNQPTSMTFVYSWPGLARKEIVPGGKAAHNVFKFDGEMTICDSANYRLLQPRSNKTLFQGNSYLFLRGAALSKDTLVIGYSGRCKIRNERGKEQGGLIFFDGLKFGSPTYVSLNSGPVEEIRILDEPDSAHGQPPFWGKDCPWSPDDGKRIAVGEPTLVAPTKNG